MAKILFLTDSAADIPKSLREELGIRVMPFPIAMGERELRDGEDFTPQEFYQALAEEPKIPTHAQLTAYQFQQCYEETWKAGYTDLIYTSINSEGSATYQNAVQARGEFFEDHPEARDAFSIRVIDSHTYTMCYGYPVAEGARMAAAGASVEEIAAYIQDWVDHVRVLFVSFDLKFAKKSGRVSAAAAFVGEALGLKPIMTFENGASKVVTKVRGEKNVIPTILELAQKEREPGTPYLIIRAARPDQAELLTESCRQAFGQEPAMDCFIGGVIAINAGLIWWDLSTGRNKTGRAAGPGSCGAPYFVLPARAGREEERKRGRDPRDLHIIHPFCDRLDYAMEN